MSPAFFSLQFAVMLHCAYEWTGREAFLAISPDTADQLDAGACYMTRPLADEENA
jgi:hypothetical protein